jgi:hypothetical protein
MPKKFRSRWPFTKKDMNINTQEHPLPLSNITSSCRWCLSIHDTPLYKFVEALCENNLQALVISGTPSEKDLSEAWENISAGYAEAIGNSEQVLYLSLLKETTRTAWTLDQIEMLIDTLKKHYAKPFATMLCRLLRVRLEFDPANPDEYDKNLKGCWNRSRGLFIDLKLKKVQLDALVKKLAAQGELPTREYFVNALIALSDHAGFHLTDLIMTSEFITRLNRFTKFVDQKNKK